MVNAKNCVRNGNGSTPLKKAKQLLRSHITPLMAAVALYYAREAYNMVSRANTCETARSEEDRIESGFWRVIGFLAVVSITFVMTAYIISMDDKERERGSASQGTLPAATQTVSGASSIDSGSVKLCTCDKRRTKKSEATGRARLNIAYEESSPTPVVARRIGLSEQDAQAARVVVRDVAGGARGQQELLRPRGTAPGKTISKGVLAAKNSILKETMKPVAGVVTQGVDTSLHQVATSETVVQKKRQTYAISKEEVKSPSSISLTSSNFQGEEFSLGSTQSSHIKASGGGHISKASKSDSRPSTSVSSATCQGGCIMCDMMQQYDYGKLLQQPDDNNAYMYKMYLNLWQQAHGGGGRLL